MAAKKLTEAHKRAMQAGRQKAKEAKAVAPEANGTVSKDQSNRPTYAVIGTVPATGAKVIVWTFPTIGRLRREWDQVINGFSAVYSDLHAIKCKRLPRVS